MNKYDKYVVVAIVLLSIIVYIASYYFDVMKWRYILGH